ncbi:MAG: four-carbon acid sugar kinase family protein [Acidobacteriota bacterium]
MIADDLSGAADCAVTCTVQGLRTVVQLSESQPADDSAQVLAIDAATRSMSSDRAAATVGRIVAGYEKSPGCVLFKKLDSLLRGHVGPELAAMRRARTPSVVVMAPALPGQGRTTIDGCQCLNGQRLPNAHAPRLLEAAGLTSTGIDLALVRCGLPNLAAKMAELARGHDVLVCDAESEADLRAIAAAIAALPQAGWDGSIIWAGSAGLARHIPEAMGIAGASGPVEDSSFRGPILMVVGSRAPLAHEQASEAMRSGMTTVLLTPETLRDGRGSLGQALDSRNDVLVVIDSSDEMAEEDPCLCAALASCIRPHIAKVGALIATGGETARALLAMSDITGLRLLREIEPGVPLAVSVGARRIPVITKSGSFGNRDTLAHCVRTLRGLKLE